MLRGQHHGVVPFGPCGPKEVVCRNSFTARDQGIGPIGQAKDQFLL